MRIWIDIENPPQVQYLLPFKAVLEALGADVTLTARDYGFTYSLLRRQHVPFDAVGASYGKGRARKVAGVLARARALAALMRRGERPAALICAGRAPVVAARALGVPSFALIDYEHVHLALFRLARSSLVVPSVIGVGAFTDRGFAAGRLIRYPGLKEDLTFASVDLDAIPPHTFAELEGADLVKVLFRPAAEESHYYRPESGDQSLRALEHLAGQERAVVIFSPRYPSQLELLRRFDFTNPPVVLEQAVPFIPLLKGVDAVVSAGGTMLREAAYLGVPAFSLFRGEPGGVDRHLERLGRLHFVRTAEDLDALRPERVDPSPPLGPDPSIIGDLAERILARAGAVPAGRAHA